MKIIHIVLAFAAALLSSGCQQSPAQDRNGDISTVTPPIVLDAKASAGKKVFLEHSRPACSQCHTLKNAGAQARIGANLDDLKPDIEAVRRSVTDGSGIMPPQADRLTAEQIDAVAYYVATVAGKTD
jgi:mono/diheme cytochrome c family protein